MTFDGCIECWEEFRYDDCGGYNPPCKCGFHCRRCHDLEQEREAEYAASDEWRDDPDWPEDNPPAEPTISDNPPSPLTAP